jgi:hypothetical protein
MITDQHMAGDESGLIGKEEPNGTGPVATPLANSQNRRETRHRSRWTPNPPRRVTVTGQAYRSRQRSPRFASIPS